MNFKLLKYLDRYESTCTDEDGTVWHEATWGFDCDPVDIKRESLLLAQDAKAHATTAPEEVIIPDPVLDKLKR